MKIFASGSWHEESTRPYSEQAYLLGRLIAEHNHALVAGPGTGISKYIIAGYRDGGGHRLTVYLPAKKHMDSVGEKLLTEPDETIQTNLDYPQKNIEQVKASDAVIMITGGAGSLTEIIHAANDYGLPVACLDGSGDAIEAVKHVSNLEGKIFFSKDIRLLLAHVEEQA